MDTLPIIISAFALFISASTAWLTLLRRGRLKMTRPNILAFAFDGPSGPPKLFLRSLLFSTSRRGHVVEGMYLTLEQGRMSSIFSDWAYGDSQLVFGSGLHVPYEGFVSNYHFLLPRSQGSFLYIQGQYSIRVYAKTTHRRSARLLFQTNLTLDETEAKILNEGRNIIFTWDPTKESYVVSDKAPKAFKVLFEI
jgi:hypothetical protein